MNTSVKVSVADRCERSFERTTSGGVRDPSDPSHFPSLGSNGASSPRRLSRMSSSYKESLNSDKAPLAVRTDNDPAEVGNPSDSDGGGKVSRMQPLGSPSRSPKIAAERSPQASTSLSQTDAPSGAVDKPVQADTMGDNTSSSSGASGYRAKSDTGYKEEVRTAPVKDQEGWEPVSPKKHVSQRRRTADAQAEAESLKDTIYAIPMHVNPFEPLEESEPVAETEPVNTEVVNPKDVNSEDVTSGDNIGDIASSNIESSQGLEDYTQEEEEEWTNYIRDRRRGPFSGLIDGVRGFADHARGFAERHPVVTTVAVATITTGVCLLARRRR